LDLSRRTADPYSVYKDVIGRSLLLGLEFLVAADVIRTVAPELTPRNIGMLGNGAPERLPGRIDGVISR
jgi:uncharacterized membrane protein